MNRISYAPLLADAPLRSKPVASLEKGVLGSVAQRSRWGGQQVLLDPLYLAQRRVELRPLQRALHALVELSGHVPHRVVLQSQRTGLIGQLVLLGLSHYRQSAIQLLQLRPRKHIAPCMLVRYQYQATSILSYGHLLTTSVVVTPLERTTPPQRT